MRYCCREFCDWRNVRLHWFMVGRNVETARAEIPPDKRPAGKLSAPQEFGHQCGGQGGVPFRVFATPPASIRKVTVWHKQYVDGIQFATEHVVLPHIGETGLHRDVR